MNLYEQQTIFDLMYPKYKIKKPIRLIELFAGYGSQALALKYLNIEFEHWKICEWAIKSIQAYKDMHFTNDNLDYSEKLTKDDIIKYLLEKGISSNYNNPMNEQQINRLNENNLRRIYNNIMATKNLVNIQQIKGKDLEIMNDEFIYMLTYSFPCQDLSLAGKGKGMHDTTTRSGMLWEVERILKECDKKPDILLMENVPQVHGIDNKDAFMKWQLSLENMGYKNYYKDLSAIDYGIPQTRVRCFMISILGDYNYKFPNEQTLNIKLSDLLEDDVSNKYFLSERMLNCFTKEKVGGYPRKQRFEQSIKRVNDNDIANTLTTLEGNRDISTFIIVKDKDGKEKIRKLTPRECFKLMGVNELDFENIKKNQSDNSLYHLAGDSIVVNILMAIFKELF